jgi:hypothetical protein
MRKSEGRKEEDQTELIPETRRSMAEGAIREFERRDCRVKECECEVKGRVCRPWWLRE